MAWTQPKFKRLIQIRDAVNQLALLELQSLQHRLQRMIQTRALQKGNDGLGSPKSR